ncbi:lycopene beta-cyclase CrtY [Erythrobacter sp. HL-111]|uniref:lycopene beta-cyclase CrtY n=1 Tax=Erythrobacter sp. HL-111 TaxID=1798193 RepID=UPI0006DA97DB|nr:lycopene beta-cyclase CrtY [Erythrobacter sp. HL-111]KPP87953.1 MAG: lycopene beta-cyclase CrtY [Erythrobacteraceae bacterium HL-111]SDS43807.1 lycopene beta-cyclase [Erythrobacter sp. HL-111]
MSDSSPTPATGPEAQRGPKPAELEPRDVVIVGGGLAGGLLALALLRRAPAIRFTLVEAGKTLGGNHRWSWFATDLAEACADLLGEFPLARWDAGYDIAFPGYGRTLGTSYRSLASEDFHKHLAAAIPAENLLLGKRVAGLDAGGVTLADGTRIAARRVVDCRTFRPSDKLAGGWQVFLGQHIRCHEPHGLTRPVIMDATVDQLAPHGNGAAYRFVYVLPLSEDEVFVEDTYYADHPRMDRDLLASRTRAYARTKGWRGEVIGSETGILPVISGGDFEGVIEDLAIPGVAIAGSRGGFSHPLTSYTLPFAASNAVEIAALLADHPDTTGEDLARFCEDRARHHWRETSFYRMLSRMLFEAADPGRRVNVFKHFYGLSGELVERFYAGQSTWPDRLRILSGKPPVAIGRAMRAMVSRGKPFRMEKTA